MTPDAPGADIREDVRPDQNHQKAAPTTTQAATHLKDSGPHRQSDSIVPASRELSIRDAERHVRRCDRALRMALRELPPCREVERLMDATVPARVALRRRKARAALASVRESIQ